MENLPYGHQRLVEIARALGTLPALLFLDEPAAGMNPQEILHLKAIIQDLKAAGCGHRVIEHHMDLVMSLCQSITVLDFGQQICQGTPAEVQGDEKVCTAYLGGPRPRRHRPVEHPRPLRGLRSGARLAWRQPQG